MTRDISGLVLCKPKSSRLSVGLSLLCRLERDGVPQTIRARYRCDK